MRLIPNSDPPPVQPQAGGGPVGAVGTENEKGRTSYAQARPVFEDDYEARFPEDAYCEETAPNARVWRVYNEEAEAFDATMDRQYRDGLDVILVFAGLFSAVVTSFLVQVSDNLQADFTEMSALLLHDLVVMQLSADAQDSSRANITLPSADPTAHFTPDSIDVWINGLWAVSLALSLVVALSAVLVKQWLHHYMSIPSGTPGMHSHIRQFRWMGFEQWRVSVIIGVLPIIMHSSLGLFLAGLVLFYVPLRVSLAWTIGTIGSMVVVLYIIANTIPLFRVQCPYQTPLTDFLHLCHQFITTALHFATAWFRRKLDIVEDSSGDLPALDSYDRSHDIDNGSAHGTVSRTLKTREIDAVHEAYDGISVDALSWLFGVSSNPSVQNIVVQAIGGLPPDVKERTGNVLFGDETIRSTLVGIYSSLVTEDNSSRTFSCPVNSQSVVERICRSWVFRRSVDQTPMNHIANSSLGFRMQIVSWAAHPVQWIGTPTFNPKKFLCSHYGENLHPIVWRKLLSTIHFDWTSDLSMDTSFLGVILQCIFLRPCYYVWDATGHWTKPVPVFRAIDNFQRDLLVRNLTYMLQVYINPSHLSELSRYSQSSFEATFHTCIAPMSLAMGRYAVEHVRRAASSSCCYTLLGTALDYMHHALAEPGYEIAVQDLDDIQTFMLEVVTSPVFDQPMIGSDTRSRCQSYTLQICTQLFRRDNRLGSSVIFPSFRRVVCLHPSMVPNNFVWYSIERLLDQTLYSSHEEAFRVLIDEELIERMFVINFLSPPKRSSGISLSVVWSSITGLAQLRNGNLRQKVVEYLIRPENILAVAFLVTLHSPATYINVISDETRLLTVTALLAALYGLSNDCSPWKECRACMHELLVWKQNTHSELPSVYRRKTFSDEGSEMDLETSDIQMLEHFREEMDATEIRSVIEHLDNLLEDGQGKNSEVMVATPATKLSTAGQRHEALALKLYG